MFPRYYILDERGEPKLEPDMLKAAAWLEESWAHSEEPTGRRVALYEGDGFRISTVFLWLDHRWGDGPPILWETAYFAGDEMDEFERCGGSREQALAMHESMVERVLAVRALEV